jgi:hypothetical protein
MKILMISIAIFNLCICNYNGKYSKVIWDDINKNFKNDDINLGEFLISPVINGCSKNQKELIINGNIFLRNKDEKFVYLILNCSKIGKITDTLYKGNQNENFKIRVKYEKSNFLVIKKLNSKVGLKYKHAFFK